ncbi:MAG: hypothetical protein R3C61_14545 [Bacteroidia bacterium]
MNFRIFSTLLLLFIPLWAISQQAQHLDQNVNSPFEEREPRISPDGQTLYFWRRETPQNTGGVMDPGDIWYSQKDRTGKWGPAVHMRSPLNTNGHDFVWQVSPRHDTLWINQVPPGVKDAGIGYSVRSREGYWTAPYSAHIRNFVYRGSFKDYFFTKNRIMLLPNEGDDTYGGTDIYVCFPINDTAWGAPINLGPMINTYGDDDAPYLAPDGKTLYFASEGYGGKGKFDIFVSERLDNTWRNWSRPVNIGAPVNTSGDDFDFMVSYDGKTLYWCSETNSYGSNDIFYLDLSSCETTIYPQGNQTLCIGDEIELEAGFTMGRDIRYQWLKNGARIRGAEGKSLKVSEPGAYRVIRYKDQCTDTSDVSQIRFVSPPDAYINAPSSVICLDDSIQLQAVREYGYTYQWQKNKQDIPEATAQNLWVKTPGRYRLIIANGNCTATSEEMNLQRFIPPGIYTAADTVNGLLPILPRWLWTNKIPKPKGEATIKDLATGPNGGVYVLSTTDKRGKPYDQVTGFFPEGLFRVSFPEIRRETFSPSFMATDPEGNIIIGNNDSYIEKYRPDGMLMWTKNEKRQLLTGLAVDPLGFIYTSGRFRDTLALGSKRIPAANRGGMFVAKHSPKGELVWVKTFPVDYYDDDFGNSLHLDCDGNIYTAGGFTSIANFRQEVLRASLRGDSYYVARLNPDGEFKWAFKINTEKTRYRTHDIHTDCDGNTWVALNREIWRMDAYGVVRWQGLMTTPAGSIAIKTRIHSTDGDLYITGITERSEYFVTRLNRLDRQAIIWQTKSAGSTPLDLPAVTADEEGHVFIAGISKGNEFEGSQFDLTSGSPGFVMKYGRPNLASKREPLKICYGESVTLLTQMAEGLQYQWFRNGKPISGATGRSLEVRTPGTYQIKAFADFCERISEPQQVTRCGEDEPATPQVATSTPQEKPQVKPQETPQNRPEPEIQETQPEVTVETDIDYDRGGSPLRIRDRRVKKQEEIVISSPEATIYVWDHAAEDQDTVSINVNGQWLLENYALKKQKKIIPFTFHKGENFIILYAHNLGALPPNTASITVDDGVREQTLQLRSTLSNCGTLKVRYD